MNAAVGDAFRSQARHCAAMGSPFMARLMDLLAGRLSPGTPVSDRILNWQGNPAPEADSLPLRLGGALHALKLEGRALADVYPPHEVAEGDLWAAVAEAMKRHDRHILRWLQSPPQTNEVRRSAALIPALHLLSARIDLPIMLSELGCSAGLNLHADAFRLKMPSGSLGQQSQVTLTPEWHGALPQAHPPTISARQGVDLAPIDPATPEGQLRLLAYLWADQPDRIARTRAAIKIAMANPASLFKADAADWLETQLSTPAEG